MPESQDVQPYLVTEFQPFKEVHDERLFKHITFFENETDLTLRMRAVDRNYVEFPASATTQKKVATNLSISDPAIEIFRVKAVLSELDHGISESHWVTEKHAGSSPASTHNQYRIKGVSSEGWKSDWTYSELRDFDNDLIVYNMIYDVLDLLLTVHDDQIDYLLDYIVSDTFSQLIQELSPKFAIHLDVEEFKQATIQELLKVLSTQIKSNPSEQFVSKLGEQFLLLAQLLKKEFKESIMSSPKEFSELYRLYKLTDQYQSKNTDFLYLLMEIFVEDRYEKLVQNTNIEVLVQNDEEMGIYLSNTYEFNIKSELITAMYEALPDDRFLTNLNDAVQLLLEPAIYEELLYSQDESIEQFFRMALSELYTPMLAVDNLLAEVDVEAASDEYQNDLGEKVVDFSMYEGDTIIRNMILFDILEAAVKGDLQPTNELHIGFIDRMLQTAIDSSPTLSSDFNTEEFLRVYLAAGESFRYAYTSQFGNFHEEKSTTIVDKLHINYNPNPKSLKESYYAALQELHKWKLKKTPENTKEYQDVGILDLLLQQYISFKNAIQDQTNLSWSEQLDFDDMIDFVSGNDHFASSQDEMYYNLYKHYLRNPNKFPILEKRIVELTHELRDIFLMEGKDKVQYALGAMGDGWPIGVFKLGTSILKG